MTIEFRCARCFQLLRIPQRSLKKNARCPRCELLMRSPAGGATREAEANKTALQPGYRAGLPWERAEKKSFTAWVATAKRVAFRPSKAFSQMRQSGDLRSPMLYSAVGYAIGVLGAESWNILITYAWMTASGEESTAVRGVISWMLSLAAAYLLIGVPLAATLGNLISGGVLHICLIVCGGSKQSFATSFRIACYSQSSLMWLLLIPGGILAVSAWNIALSIIAVHRAHEVPMGRAVLTVLLPLIVLLVLMAILFVIFFASLMALLTQT